MFKIFQAVKFVIKRRNVSVFKTITQHISFVQGGSLKFDVTSL
ncbi:hypothetical protein SAMN05660337_1618 [Maridesulfovibrio ferrireducens]|uniref:Uncharacterized protein n=1 Tax=Maridesulfovibrio ferrireducens TaxID=246191 RepID=A0A1G9FMI4_9BACT|nr:hypothetical protein SAMN05660337_1618 [Maridesulfovibrio ferrireducens]